MDGRMITAGGLTGYDLLEGQGDFPTVDSWRAGMDDGALPMDPVRLIPGGVRLLPESNFVRGAMRKPLSQRVPARVAFEGYFKLETPGQRLVYLTAIFGTASFQISRLVTSTDSWASLRGSVVAEPSGQTALFVLRVVANMGAGLPVVQARNVRMAAVY